MEIEDASFYVDIKVGWRAALGMTLKAPPRRPYEALTRS
jgi:hypothetical protein